MKNLVKNLPQTPGIYKMKDKSGDVIYVGKAKNLRKRISTYFQKNYVHSTRTKKLIEAVADIETIQTDTELEALILENNLLQKLRPRYNILMKDDKSYVYIKVNLAEDFPAINVIRAKEIENQNLKNTKDAKYFGPKLAASKVYDTLRLLKKLFPFRQCKLNIKWDENCVEVTNRVIRYPCLEYSIKQCPGPCIGAITPDEYKKNVQQIISFLNGKTEEIENDLKQQMLLASQKKLFEKAARIRNKLISIQRITERQKITDIQRQDTDVINYVIHLGRIYFAVILIRSGKLIDQENFIFDAFELNQTDESELKEALSSFLYQYYEKASYVPKEILAPHEPDELEILKNWLSEQKTERVSLIVPQRGEKNKLLELSIKNASNFANQYRIKWMAEQSSVKALDGLAKLLDIKNKKLKRIEGFDISHLAGNETVGAMVVFENGIPKSDDYRHFKLRTIKGKPDDCGSMQEILTRRLKIIANQSKKLALRRPNKKIFEKMKKIIEGEFFDKTDLDPKTFYCFYEKKLLVGFLRLRKLSDTASEIGSLWIDPAYRGNKLGYELMKRAIQKFKMKKIYVYIQTDLENYYAEFGFKIVKEMPEFFKERAKQAAATCCRDAILMVIEKKTLSYGDPSFKEKPDLILVDGGKGQLQTALKALKIFKLKISVIALAKRLEEIFLPGKKEPIVLKEGDEVLKLLQRVRDESHRFAITFQRELHEKNLLQ